MKRIFVRKIFPYDPTFHGQYSKYDGYRLIGLQKQSPGVHKPSPLDINEKINSPIFSSELTRGVETATLTAQQLGVSETESTPLLNEIKFDLARLLTREEYEKEGSDLVRRRFIESFIKDTLLESREKIKNRIELVLDRLKGLESGNYLLVSHSFFMKFMQIYLVRQIDIFKRPHLLSEYFNPKEKTFDFAKGFEVYL